ncbi:hypothetical protein V8C86DRAFT_2707501 [Haematococcus lacustris]
MLVLHELQPGPPAPLRSQFPQRTSHNQQESLPPQPYSTLPPWASAAGFAEDMFGTTPSAPGQPQDGAARIELAQRWLLFMRHCATCQSSEGCEHGPRCRSGKSLWNHMIKCQAAPGCCNVPKCDTVRAILRHHKQCFSMSCAVCIPVKRYVNRTSSSLASAAAAQRRQQQEQAAQAAQVAKQWLRQPSPSSQVNSQEPHPSLLSSLATQPFSPGLLPSMYPAQAAAQSHSPGGGGFPLGALPYMQLAAPQGYLPGPASTPQHAAQVLL